MTKNQSPRVAERVAHYLSLCAASVKIKEYLGGGTDGDVWATSDSTAVKAFKYECGYFNERDTYDRLAEYGMTEKIDGFWVPRMIGFNDELMVVEMDLMQDPPYIIDFAKVKIDRPPDYPEETIADNERKGAWLFEHHWPEVKQLMATLESYQIYYLDPQPGNIVFHDLR